MGWGNFWKVCAFVALAVVVAMIPFALPVSAAVAVALESVACACCYAASRSARSQATALPERQVTALPEGSWLISSWTASSFRVVSAADGLELGQEVKAAYKETPQTAGLPEPSATLHVPAQEQQVAMGQVQQKAALHLDASEFCSARGAEPTQDDIKDVLHEFQCLSEQVQLLAQHMAEIDGKAQAKAAEKALKKERKAAKKAVKEERKEAEKAAKKVGKELMASTGFTDEPESGFTSELQQAVVGTPGGSTVVDSKQLGNGLPQQGGQLASSLPASSSGAASAAVVSVCQGKSCQEQGSAKLLHYIQATAGAELDVVPCKCLGKCEQGPNLRVSLPEQKPVLHTSLQDGREVRSILQGTKAQYGNDVMKSYAAAA
ncbi:hypothetical protein ABBQ38_004309 [Trebouxia sp. C0009 RCD-2024]